MKIKSLSQLKSKGPEIIKLDTLPKKISMTKYAMAKAYVINKLVKNIHKFSYEWYGFTLCDTSNIELITDIGLGSNEQNLTAYTKINEKQIEKFRLSLPENIGINGWIHSHGNLGYKHFSGTDDNNQIAVARYVYSRFNKPIEKKEVLAGNLECLVDGDHSVDDMKKGILTILGDKKLEKARLFEQIRGAFSYAVVIGDEGWHEQDIYYMKKSLLMGETDISYRSREVNADQGHGVEIELIDDGRIFGIQEIKKISTEIRKNIRGYNRLNPRIKGPSQPLVRTCYSTPRVQKEETAYKVPNPANQPPEPKNIAEPIYQKPVEPHDPLIENQQTPKVGRTWKQTDADPNYDLKN